MVQDYLDWYVTYTQWWADHPVLWACFAVVAVVAWVAREYFGRRRRR